MEKLCPHSSDGDLVERWKDESHNCECFVALCAVIETETHRERRRGRVVTSLDTHCVEDHRFKSPSDLLLENPLSPSSDRSLVER